MALFKFQGDPDTRAFVVDSWYLDHFGQPKFNAAIGTIQAHIGDSRALIPLNQSALDMLLEISAVRALDVDIHGGPPFHMRDIFFPDHPNCRSTMGVEAIQSTLIAQLLTKPGGWPDE